ncbi:hypothetical protein JAAARDRAFT_65182 [Jaapia argillacea MUCL 33604]|uniref:Uncharacterized protein n=1 Tax=Jaapia argillacea MUCL 33604 TaxID=933084 RepID=A0A067Q808_9AGAM|nr:hypothetical protein JAAARDRAFT_65182 [Jaapia argillacea MUCL 33604]
MPNQLIPRIGGEERTVFVGLLAKFMGTLGLVISLFVVWIGFFVPFWRAKMPASKVKAPSTAPSPPPVHKRATSPPTILPSPPIHRLSRKRSSSLPPPHNPMTKSKARSKRRVCFSEAERDAWRSEGEQTGDERVSRRPLQSVSESEPSTPRSSFSSATSNESHATSCCTSSDPFASCSHIPPAISHRDSSRASLTITLRLPRLRPLKLKRRVTSAETSSSSSTHAVYPSASASTSSVVIAKSRSDLKLNQLKPNDSAVGGDIYRSGFQNPFKPKRSVTLPPISTRTSSSKENVSSTNPYPTPPLPRALPSGPSGSLHRKSKSLVAYINSKTSRSSPPPTAASPPRTQPYGPPYNVPMPTP